MRNWIYLALASITLLTATVFILEWHSARQDNARLRAQLDQAEQSIQQATAKQQQRDKELTQTVAQLESLKATVKSQQDILTKLPDVLPLPKPLVAVPQTSGNYATPETPQLQPIAMPAEDLKSLYDFAVDCQVCQTRLAAVSADLADEKTKSQALGRERDAAVKAARGGSLGQRVKRAAKWFALGAVVGALAAKAH